MTWVLDIRLDTATSVVGLYAVDRATHAIHVAAIEMLTVAGVRAALEALIARHGRPDAILTDHGALFSGLGAAVGVEHLVPSQPTSMAWVERMLRRAA